MFEHKNINHRSQACLQKFTLAFSLPNRKGVKPPSRWELARRVVGEVTDTGIRKFRSRLIEPAIEVQGLVSGSLVPARKRSI